MLGYRFSKYNFKPQNNFDRLFDIFKQLLTYTSGDVAEALNWLTELDKEYKLTTPDYGIGDFINELRERGYIKEEQPGSDAFSITSKTEKAIRESSLERIFGKLKKGTQGNHKTRHTGTGDELSSDLRNYQFGDSLEQISMLESFRNAQINHGIGEFMMSEDDLMVRCLDERYDELLEKSGARPMDFTGKPMKGFLFVGLEDLKTNKQLKWWLDVGIEFVLKSPAKKKKKK